MNDILLVLLVLEDVKRVIYSIVDLKTPGLDSLHAIFYRKY